MRAAYGLMICFLFIPGNISAGTEIQNFVEEHLSEAEIDQLPSRPLLFPDDVFLHAGLRFWRRGKTEEFSTRYSRRTNDLLYDAVMGRIGLPYRYGGEDDRGYDCSGFVWSVCQEAGIHFERSTTRDLWETLPEASRKDEGVFGTLVFFKGLTHMGIVRDDLSFYHASSSQGVIESYFDEYWGPRVLGFRRALAPVERKRKKVRPRY